MKVKFKPLNFKAVLPSYSKEGDAGLDLTCTEVESNLFSNEFTCKTGVAVEIPKGYVGLLFPRSSVSKTSLSLKNAVGIIDSGYRGEIMMKFRIHDAVPNVYNPGDRVGQLVIVPYPQIEPEWSNELSNTDRGSGGFGSSGV